MLQHPNRAMHAMRNGQRGDANTDFEKLVRNDEQQWMGPSQYDPRSSRNALTFEQGLNAPRTHRTGQSPPRKGNRQLVTPGCQQNRLCRDPSEADLIMKQNVMPPWQTIPR